MKKSKNIYIYVISLFCILSLIPFIIASFYSRPSADDFDYSYPLRLLINSGNYNIFSLLINSIKMMINFYFSWQGTYSSAILMSLQTGIWGDKYYFIGVLLLIVLMYICLYRFFYILNKRIINKVVPTWFLSLIFLTTLIQTAPYICQCLYWQCGAFHYVPFFFLDLVVVSYIVDYYFETDRNRKKKCILMSSIFSFIISGGNQVTSFLNILILFLVVIYSIYKKKEKGVAITLLVAIVGFAIMFFAPGNSVRESAAVQTNVFVAILNSFKGGIKYALRWPNLAWFSLIVLVVLLLIPFVDETKYKVEINPLLIIVITLLLYTAMFCPTNYAMSTNGPGRLKNVIYFAGVMFSVFDVMYLLVWLKQKYNFSLHINNYLRIVLIVLLSFTMCFAKSNNVTLVYQELSSGMAENFAKSYDDRIKQMQNSKEKIVVVKNLPDSEVLKFDDITNDINDWRNQSWSTYYGVDTITEK